ncbi:hypothetical protein [Dongshaea marina]|uniref:hypothetical protein n=1 Tax=Dongshaea marina TaxID=2047966 RepID=UPI00131ED826|nr:hypothetical protein [Dongshaea marina]
MQLVKIQAVGKKPENISPNLAITEIKTNIFNKLAVQAGFLLNQGGNQIAALLAHLNKEFSPRGTGGNNLAGSRT